MKPISCSYLNLTKTQKYLNRIDQFLQLDIKILAKVLALCLNKVILSLIHSDQTGFMPAKNTVYNLHRLHMNLQAEHDQLGSRVVAFDSVEWVYLWECLT